MDLNLIVVGLIIVTVVIGAYLGYLLSPQRGCTYLFINLEVLSPQTNS
jgi:hypothetical protein